MVFGKQDPQPRRRRDTAVAAYGSLAPADGLFIDGMVARGWLDFDMALIHTPLAKATRRPSATSAGTPR
ncbi:hypothetical protein [Caulobacter zeae]|uniref:hypothetical protein n=1 Tax=Caulobacter zeae TaxID=2055137 RepID=UPI0013FDDB79|nr:hypothetical protein [Caulobacter zeae]